MLMFLVALFSLLISSATSAEYFWGRCPSAPPMKDFTMDKFLGLWYIVEAFDDGEKCMTWNITRDAAPHIWRVAEDKENGPFHAAGISHAKFNTGTLTQRDKVNPAKMRSYWPISGIAGETEFTVHDTDYENYASVFECQNVGVFHKENGLILSRTPVLRVDLRQMARIRAPDIKVAYYRRVLHSGCKYRTQLPDNNATTAAIEDTYGLRGDRVVPDSS
ncbi:apolipoprotein D-like [Macrobrachium nipponense]|uniref:apolipoprotein D-like n=1 Tax=Macrobrachium nipponense TaxID=159736 RepID=UPI0030C88E94